MKSWITIKRKRKLFLIFLIAFTGFLSLAILNSINLEHSFNDQTVNPVDEIKNQIDFIKKQLSKLERKENDYSKNIDKIKDNYENLVDKQMQAEERLKLKLVEELKKKLAMPTVKPSTAVEQQQQQQQKMTETATASSAVFQDNQCSWLDELDAANYSTNIKVSNLYDVLDFVNVKSALPNIQVYDIYDLNSNEWSNDKKLHVIITPHSHNDPGWLLTFEEYFDEATKNILNTIVEALSEKESRTFIWAEISYLSLWWNQANQTMRDKMRHLIVDTKQLEIVTGGWVMTDEANSYYYAMIEQMIEGHEWLKTNIDSSIAPSYGWSIDPFGYSSTMAYLLKQMGFDAMLIQRVHYFLKEYMKYTQKFEFTWRQSWSTKSSKSTDMFCHVMPYGHYDVPSTCGPDSYICCQFDFKRLNNAIPCPGEPAVEITDANIHERASTLLTQYKKKAKLYGSDKNHNVVFVPLGDDFRWKNMQEAHDQYRNYEKLIDYMNNNKQWNVDVRFGTLKDYFELAKKFNKDTLETLSGDFFTYADSYENYWSGYFTSRAYFKRLDRLVEYYLRTAEILFTYSNILKTIKGDRSAEIKTLYEELLESRRNLGIFQHHDGITGTAKKAVVLDYEKKLVRSLENSKNIIEQSSSYLLSSSKENLFSVDDLKLNSQIDIDLLKDNDQQVIVIFNPSTNHRHELVNFKLNTPFVKLYDQNDNEIIDFKLSLIWPNNVDLNLPNENEKPVINEKQIPNINTFASDFDQSYFELLFKVNIEPLTFNKFKIKRVSKTDFNLNNNNNNNNKITKVTYFSSSLIKNSQLASIAGVIKTKMNSEMNQLNFEESIDIKNIVNKKQLIQIQLDGMKGFFNATTGLIDHLVLSNGESLHLESGFLKYTSFRSGAYLFLPDGPAKPIDYERLFKWIRVEDSGNLRQRVCTNLTIVLHCLEISPAIDSAVGSHYPLMNVWNMVDLRTSFNYELVMTYNPKIDNDETIFTDLNGFQYTKRKMYTKIPIQGNVYPMPSGAFIQDAKLRMTLLSAQPSGVSTAKFAKMKVFLDRKLEQDDFKGLEQAANDNRQTLSRFVLLFEKINVPDKNIHLARLDYPSLLSQIYSFHLLNPLLKMNLMNQKETAAVKNSECLLGKSVDVPCDLRVLNMRSMQNVLHEARENDFGLILHRLASDDCSGLIELPEFYKTKCSSKSTREYTFNNLLDYFKRQLSEASKKSDIVIENTLLTLTSIKAEQGLVNKQLKESNNDVRITKLIEPMQIEAFKVYFFI